MNHANRWMAALAFSASLAGLPSLAFAAPGQCPAEVLSDVAAARAELPLLAPPAPLPLAALKGKTLWYVSVTFNQFSSDWVAGLREAAALAGVRVVTFDGQGSASRFNEGIGQAVAQGAAGIIVAAIDPALISAPLAEAKAAGIPVMNGFNGDPKAALPNGMYGNFSSDFTADGATAAKWAMADSGCAARMVLITSSSVAVWQNVAAGARAAFARHCRDCTLKVLDVDIANIATNLGSQLQAALQQDPGIGYIFPAGDSLVPFIAPITSAAGSKAKVMGRDGLASSLRLIATRGGQDMTLAMPDFKWLGWLAFDDLARAILKLPRTGYTVPARIVDARNVGDGQQEKLFPAYVGYRQAFQKAWQP